MRRILVFCLAAASGLGYITPSFATAPTYVADGFTQEISGTSASLKFRANIGTPSNGDLVTLFVDCYDLTQTNAVALNTPSGWTQELHRQSADTFGDQAVYWRKADGTEGATLDFTLPNNTSECSSWYVRSTGHDATNPVDATDVAWSDSLTQDPPSQTVSGGPLDVYYLAFAHNRGDNTWSSGPGMTTDAHSNSSLAVGRSVGTGRQSATSSSSFNPSAVVFAGSSRLGGAMTAVIYGAVAAGPPSFTAGPSYSTVSNTAISATFTSSAASITYYCALYLKGATAPTAAQIAAGTNAHSSVATGTTTGASETHNITATDSPTNPAYDPYCVLKDGSSVFSSVPSTSSTCTVAPTNFQYTNCPTGLTSLGTGSPPKKFNDYDFVTIPYGTQTGNYTVARVVVGATSGAWGIILADADSGATGTLTLDKRSGTFQNGELLVGSAGGSATSTSTATNVADIATTDILVVPTTVSPSLAALSVAADGQYSYSASGRQTALNGLVYDNSAKAYMALDLDAYLNNAVPTCAGGTLLVVVQTGVAMDPIDLDNYCSDADSESLTYAIVSGSVPGLSLNATTGVLSGTSSGDIETDLSIVALDPATDYTTKALHVISQTLYIMPDCVSVLTLDSACSAAIQVTGLGSITSTASFRCNLAYPTGYVISQSPAPGTSLSPGDHVSTVVSFQDLCIMPNCLAQTVTMCQTDLLDVSSTATLTQGTGCTSGSSVVYSQAPAVGTPVDTGFSLTVFCR